mmetsp:Transcript_14562/g.43469  ORF Transcript_14562/g.43469 Transcript_14562/m.43469 type:complete len:201 (-) Transcript_14562:506-1108(-)
MSDRGSARSIWPLLQVGAPGVAWPPEPSAMRSPMPLLAFSQTDPTAPAVQPKPWRRAPSSSIVWRLRPPTRPPTVSLSPMLLRMELHAPPAVSPTAPTVPRRVEWRPSFSMTLLLRKLPTPQTAPPTAPPTKRPRPPMSRPSLVVGVGSEPTPPMPLSPNFWRRRSRALSRSRACLALYSSVVSPGRGSAPCASPPETGS